jgi:hypothetical protein
MAATAARYFATNSVALSRSSARNPPRAHQPGRASTVGPFGPGDGHRSGPSGSPIGFASAPGEVLNDVGLDLLERGALPIRQHDRVVRARWGGLGVSRLPRALSDQGVGPLGGRCCHCFQGTAGPRRWRGSPSCAGAHRSSSSLRSKPARTGPRLHRDHRRSARLLTASHLPTRTQLYITNIMSVYRPFS